MGYALLWIEGLVLGLLLVATAMAGLARTRLPHWVQCCCVVVVVLVPLSLFGTILGGAAWLRFERGMLTGLYVPLLALLISFVVLVIGLMFWGLRRRNETVAAAGWSLGKSALALLVVLVLVTMTYWNLDLAVSQRLATVRVEAGALALAVSPPKLPEKDNAALVYGRVFASWDNDSSWPAVFDKAADALTSETSVAAQGEAEKPTFDFLDPALADFLDEHAADLTLLRKGAALPGCRFDRDFGRPRIDTMLPELQHMRTATRMLGIEARYLAAKGETGKALENVQAMFSLAQHTASDPFLVSALVGIAIDGMAVATLETVLPGHKLTAEDSVDLEIPSANTFQNRITRAFRMEEAMALWLFSEMNSQRDWVKTISMADLDGGSSGIFPGFASLYRVFLLKQDMDQYRDTIASFEILGSQPYHKVKKHWDEREQTLTEKGGGLMTSLLLPALTNCVKASVRGDAQHRTAQVAWAMHRYRATNGDFPEKLADLKPETLMMLPLDPYDSKPLRLKYADDGWVAYSIGPDMTDDGGVPMDRDSQKGDITFVYQKVD